MRTALMVVAAALSVAGCSQNGDQATGPADGVADPGLPGGAVPARGSSRVTIIPGVTVDQQAVLDGCLSAADQSRPAASFSPEERATRLACINRAMAAQVRPQLPVRIDSLTTLTALDTDGLNVTYFYAVDVDAKRVVRGAVDQAKAAARSNACGNPQMRQGLDVGGSYTYRWSDKNGHPIGDLRIDQC